MPLNFFVVFFPPRTQDDKEPVRQDGEIVPCTNNLNGPLEPPRP